MPSDASNSPDLTIYIPNHLRKYLITLDADPVSQDKFNQAVKQQKVRYLYLRYLNQIKYGCKNPRCTAPTCFSNRSRLSKGVVRPYTTLSANALALQCVEEYDKDSSLRTNGLCYNEPLFPWFEQPEEDLRSALYVQGVKVSRKHVNETSSHNRQPVHEKKDHASFTQQLFDRLELRQLRILNLEDAGPLPSRAKGKQREGESSNPTGIKSVHEASSHCVLGTISAQVLEWFQKQLGEASDLPVLPENSTDWRGRKSHSDFLDCCIAYMFSHPRKFSSSVMRWGSINGRVIRDEAPEVLPSCPELRSATFILCHCMGGDTTRLLRHSFATLQHPHIEYLCTHPSALYGKSAAALTRELAQLMLFHEAVARSTRGYLHTWEREIPTLRKHSHHSLFERHSREIGKIMSTRLMHELRASANLQGAKLVKLTHAMLSVIRMASPTPERVSNTADWADFWSGFLYRLFTESWSFESVIARSSIVFAILEMLRVLHDNRFELELKDNLFNMAMPEETFDELDMPFEWYSFRPTAIAVHILQYPFVFPAKTLVSFFRSLNFKLMKVAHEKAMTVRANAKAQLVYGPWQLKSSDQVMEQVRPHMAKFFVMSIRRQNILEDSINQIWQREVQELTRPLRVKLGEDTGEEGLDHGGVQQELFRLIFAEAFDNKYGMFTTDPKIHMSWFNPASLEPLFKYEALGVLFALAVYNGVVLPLTLPRAFYQKLLGLKVKTTDDIRDGWPELAHSFDQLLAWNQGDVSNDMSITYEFSYDAYGERRSIDMSKRGQCTPKPELTEEITCAGDVGPLPVTNKNRKRFVKDYISHLTDITVRSQLSAFFRGIHRLLSPRALGLFTPYVLKQLVEGQPADIPLDLVLWESIVDYENGYSASCQMIRWFWDILHNDFSQAQLRSLLAFVTASDRLPVGGWSGTVFTIVKNGDDNDGRLPTSSTCYGKLLLPQYSSRDILKDRLEWCTSQAWGFWMV